MPFDEGRNSRADLAFGAGFQDMKFKPEDVRSLLRLSYVAFAVRIGRINQRADDSDIGHGFVQHFQHFRHDGRGEKAHARDVATRSVHAGDKAELDRIAANGKDDGSPDGRRLGRQRRSVTGGQAGG